MSIRDSNATDSSEPSIQLPEHVGPYRAVGLFGRGGISSVLLAVRPGEGTGVERFAVVKRPRASQFAREASFLQSFHDEALLAARLHHPNIAQIYDVGHDGRQPFIAMEFIAGQSLALVAERARSLARPLPIPVVLRVFFDVLDALEYAHQMRDFDGSPLCVIHRDATPSNVFVSYDGVTKVMDFGIARSAMQREKTGVGIVKGKLEYMAPEQLRDAPLGPVVDVWTVAVGLWEAIAGRSLFSGANNGDTIARVILHEVPKLSALREDVPKGLDGALAAALDRDPAKRVASASELKSRLTSAVSHDGGVADHSVVARYMSELFGEARERNHQLLNELLQSRSATSHPSARFFRFDSTGLLEMYSEANQVPFHRDRITVDPKKLPARATPAPVGATSSAPTGSSVPPADEEPEPRPASHWIILGTVLVAAAAIAWRVATG